MAHWTLARRMFERQKRKISKGRRFRDKRHEEARERLPLARNEEIPWLIQHQNLFDVWVVNERGKSDKIVEKIQALLDNTAKPPATMEWE